MALLVVNRILLALLGVLMFAGGGAALAAGSGLFGAGRASAPVLAAGTLMAWERSPWWWPGLVAGLAAVFVAALCWAFAQVGRGRRRAVGLPTSDTLGIDWVRSHALADAVVAAFERIPSVDQADVRMVGRRRTPGVRVAVIPTALAEPGTLAAEAIAGPVAELRRCLERADLPVEIVLRARATGSTPPPVRVE